MTCCLFHTPWQLVWLTVLPPILKNFTCSLDIAQATQAVCFKHMVPQSWDIHSHETFWDILGQSWDNILGQSWDNILGQSQIVNSFAVTNTARMGVTILTSDVWTYWRPRWSSRCRCAGPDSGADLLPCGCPTGEPCCPGCTQWGATHTQWQLTTQVHQKCTQMGSGFGTLVIQMLSSLSNQFTSAMGTFGGTLQKQL